MQPFREKALGRENEPKLASKWYGPFRVLQKVGTGSYRILLPESAKIHDVFHVNQLKKHIGTQAIPNDKLPLVTAEGKIKIAPVKLPSVARYQDGLLMVTTTFLYLSG
jgi:hypothetical protein